MVKPHKLALKLHAFADHPLGLLAQLVLFRVAAMCLAPFAHRSIHLTVAASWGEARYG
jgi:hypothetical protein